MSGRVLLLILFLYTALAWVVAGMRPEGQFVHDGLLWTAIGLAVAIMAVIVRQCLGVWRAYRERRASKPLKPTPVRSLLSDEAVALDALRREALARLSASPGMSRMGDSAFLGRGLFLVLGPSNSGKTRTLMNSGMDPQLLAGQVRGDSEVVPTRVANFWLAQESIFVELSGRLYETDQARWFSLLKVLVGESNRTLWRRVWRDEQPPMLRGVLLFHDVQCTMATPDSAPTGAQSRIAQERLQAVADVFGMTVPVYAIFTKSDSVKFFGEYFGRLPPSEAAQAFGFTLAADRYVPPANPMPWSEKETRRLTKAFSAVYRHLAERRLLHLMRESDPSRKPDIYEFPREFRRIRGVLVQLLTDAFKPDPLKPGPALRGFYFTGTRAAETAIADQFAHGLDQTSLGGQQSGRGVDYSDATRIFESGGFKAIGQGASGARGRAPIQQQWMFTRQLFLETIPADLPPVVTPLSQPILEKYRGRITASVAGLSLLMGLIWIQSWWRNRDLIQTAEASIEKVERFGNVSGGGLANLEYLRAIDQIRGEILGLNDKPLAMRWLLYTGDDVRAKLEDFYFRRIDVLLLRDLNRRLADRLGRLTPDPPESAEFEPVYKQLETHLAITGGECKPVDTVVVSDVLKSEAKDAGLMEDPEHKRLIEAQLDFYAQALPGGYPVRLQENEAARDRARTYLSKVKNLEWYYQQSLKTASQKLQGTVSPDFGSGAVGVFKGPTDMPAVFTPEGWRNFSKEARGASKLSSGNSCVLGPPADSGAVNGRDDDALTKQIRIKYLLEYKERWKQFLAAQKFEQYSGPGDAINKLERLSGNQSPALALIAFASKYTYFPPELSQASALDKIIGQRVPDFAKKVGKSVEQPASLGDRGESPTRVSNVFQPARSVVAPDAKKLVADNAKAYVEALAELKDRLKDLYPASTTHLDPTLIQPASLALGKALDAVRQLTYDFNSKDSEGLDSIVKHLLEAPINQTRRWIPENVEKSQSAVLNGGLRTFCQAAIPVLQKYPFTPTVRNNDASLEDLNSLLAPETGTLWKLPQASLSDLVMRQGSKWSAKTEGQKPSPSGELITFLNRMQTLTDTLYPGKASQPSLQYSLRPVAGSLKGFSVGLTFDGKNAEFTEGSALQKQFTWPAAPSLTPGAKAWISNGGSPNYFGSSTGLWGVFKVFRDADKRELGSRQVQWSGYEAAGGDRVQLQKIVQFEFVGSQGAAELLNPKFFEGLRCPGKAVQ